MRNFFGYIRVSTAKQGEHGVSLQEQREAILRCAQRNGLEIGTWFEERVTAAKRGRPAFNQMLKLLQQGKACGVIIHKIDRSARNLRDWADLGELIDRGIDVHFANESLDLHSRGGRLSADIQAVVAADYVRNLREEAKKGIYGRLKQGIFPFPAPLGYLDRGKARPKEPDPISAPLVRKVFELYATGRFNIDNLSEEMNNLGLRNRNGGKLSRSGIAELLNNPFYFGLIRIKRNGEIYPGAHKPLIRKSLFDRVQMVLAGKFNSQIIRHDFLFRRLLKCDLCGYSLIGERQKGHVYYRCQTKSCPTTTVREEAVEEAVVNVFRPLRFSNHEQTYLQGKLEQFRSDWSKQAESHLNGISLQLGKLTELLTRLTDAYLNGVIERELFEERKSSLLMERKDLEEKLVQLREDPETVPKQVENFLELADTALLSYEMGTQEDKQDLLRIVTSNRAVERKSIRIQLSNPFRIVADREKSTNGPPYRDRPRTLDVFWLEILSFFQREKTSR